MKFILRQIKNKTYMGMYGLLFMKYLWSYFKYPEIYIMS